ncbi:MAG: ATPase [Chloroflexi bacterium]|nr:ATPase [Chloroflexota bacterium]
MAVRGVIGIDGGGTKTMCVLAAEDGAELARHTGGPSNLQTIGAPALESLLGEIIGGVLRRARGSVEVVGMCLALAGVDRPEDRTMVEAIVGRVMAPLHGVANWGFGAGEAVIVNDAVASLVGGTGRRHGVVMVAGTGSIAFGMNARREHCRAGGWGNILGDEGSGYAIGLAGLRAVCRAWDRRGPATSLMQTILDAHRLRTATELIPLVYGQWGVREIAAVAPLVLAAAGDGESGDPVAQRIAGEAADELALATLAVIRALELQTAPFDVVTAGGVWAGSAFLRERFAAMVRREAPPATISLPRNEPVIGAVLLAREAAGAVSLG